MTDTDLKQNAVDVTEIALVSSGALVGGPVGAGLGVVAVLVNKLARPLERRREQRQQRFLESVGVYLDAGDPEGAAAFVDSAVDTDEFADVLERGYERMRRSYDPLAEECICVLTAEHLRVGRPSAREYVAVGAVLEACDASLLGTIHDITSLYRETDTDRESSHRILFDSFGVPDGRGPFFFVTNYARGGREVASSRVIETSYTMTRALGLLSQHGFGSIWQGVGTEPPEGMSDGSPNCRHHFARSEDSALRLLARCLVPVDRVRAAQQGVAADDATRRS